MRNINFTYTNLTPFKWYVLENFPFIEADFDALTNWQLFCKLGKEMNKIINSVNLSGEQVETLTTAFNNLQNYVNNYFSDLNIQEEVNNKLDEMVKDGTLANIINNQIFNDLNKKIDNPLIGKYKSIVNDDVNYNCWPVSLVMNDIIYCYYCKRVSHQDENNKGMKGNSICMKYSEDGGLTWSDEERLFYNENYDYTTFGGVVVNNSYILLWVTEIDVDNNYDSKYYQYKSLDGRTFNKNFTFNDSTDPLVSLEGYINMGIVTKTGRIITSKQCYNGGDGTRKTVVLYSDTGGTGWEAVEIASVEDLGNYNNLPWECRFVETEEGIIGYGRNNLGYAYQFTSINNGNTWTEPQLTNLKFTRNVPIAPFLIKRDSSITSDKLIIVTCDRYGNGFYKYELLPQAIFNNPLLYPEPEILSFSSSKETARDWGYGNLIQYNSTRKEDLGFIFYTTKSKATTLGGKKDCSIAIYYLSTYDNKILPNILRNGNLKDCKSQNVNSNTPTWIGDNIAIKSTNDVNILASKGISTIYGYPLYIQNVTNKFDIFTWLYGYIGINTIRVNFYARSNGTLNIYNEEEKIGSCNIFANTRNDFSCSFYNKKRTSKIRLEFNVTNQISLYTLGIVHDNCVVNNYSTFFNNPELFYEELGNTRLNKNWESSVNVGCYTNLFYSRKYFNPTITCYSYNDVVNKITPRKSADTYLNDVDINISGITHTKANISCYSPLSDGATLYIANKFIVDCRPDISDL